MLLPSIACNLDKNLLQTALPLFESGKVEGLEWSFDALFKRPNIPDWFQELLLAYANEGRLIGHGVYFSLFSGKWMPEQAEWLTQLRQFAKAYRFDHVTEHFGFMTGEDFHKGAPLSIPFTNSTVAIGIDRLKRIQDACNCPVGLENLAFAYGLEEVKKHGEFLEKLIEPVNGFIILDLHNLFCQLHNFEVGFDEILALYPLQRVREIHISGGSWEDSMVAPNRKVRRDTHDEPVPETVFDLLEKTIGRCPNLKFVVLEQLSNALNTEEEQLAFRQDFWKMNHIIVQHNAPIIAPTNDFMPMERLMLASQPAEDLLLAEQQAELSNILETAANYEDGHQRLLNSTLENSAWQVENWNPAMLETAIAIARKWKQGF
ncbi:MAG: DUF692 family protein [Saprospiraceae bacterium]|nr:DUF692 family protein [Saprospiraceae bacterium]